MAIQISEKKLSPKAKKALNNAKNKSQFLREALEYYVRCNDEILVKNTENEKNDELILEINNINSEIKEIKEMFKDISFEKSSFEKSKPSLNDDGMSEEEKRRIANMLDDSLNMF